MSNHIDLFKMWKDLSSQPPYNPHFDKKWKPTFIKFAPYTSLGLCLLMALSGLLSRNLPLSNSEWRFAIMATLMVSALLFIARKVKKIHRNPTIPLMMAHIVPLWGLFVIFVFLLLKLNFVAPSRIEERPISNIVREQIAERKELLEIQSNAVSTVIDQQQIQVEDAIDEIKEHIDEKSEEITPQKVLSKLDIARERMFREWKESHSSYHMRFPSSDSNNKTTSGSTQPSQDPKS